MFGQRYASSGAPQGTEFLVNTYTTSAQSDPAVASASAGNFVVVWGSDRQDGSEYGVFGQRFVAPVAASPASGCGRPQHHAHMLHDHQLFVRLGDG